MRDAFITHDGQAPFVLGILLLPQFSLLSLASTMEPLRAANRVADLMLYRRVLLSADGGPVQTSSGVRIPVEGPLTAAQPLDALVVVAAFDVVAHAKPVLSALRRFARQGLPIGGVEAGSWVLALAGLLDGRRATTHWEDLAAFADAFPAVEAVPDRFVIDGPRFTTGGAAPALDMMLELIRAQHGLQLALDVASVFIYDTPRPAAEPQHVVSLGRLALEEPRVARAIRLMEGSIASPIPLPQIARAVGLSARSVELLFRRHLGTTPGSYFLDLRLNTARRMLVAQTASVAVAAEATGFGSSSAFARAFRQRFGRSPGEARRGTQGR